ncbi:hypothetical protein [Ammoniphilus sp. 3BR4]|uniref:hypothetical protein n=1 Tax=Ammoniphilus sp. 3BR4 TaxID=3158265 RepID=UPI003466BB99
MTLTKKPLVRVYAKSISDINLSLPGLNLYGCGKDVAPPPMSAIRSGVNRLTVCGQFSTPHQALG